MNQPLDERAVVNALASEVPARIIKKTITDLRRMKLTLSGADSGLKTTWDEICVQVQDGDSFFWDAYDDTVKGLLGGYVEKLPEHERCALWLQTSEGYDWKSCEPDEREDVVVGVDDVIADLSEELYSKAADWRNARIEAYIEHSC